MAALRNTWKGKNGPLLIAEVGGNHEGDFDYAKRLVELAINSQVDIVKLQLYTGSNLVSPIESKKRRDHFRKFELTKKNHIYLAEMCKESGVKYLASVWDLEMLKWIDKYLDYYKIGSGDLTAYPIIKQFAKNGKPIILSTGLSDLREVKETVEFLQSQNSNYKNKEFLALLQCTSTYPTIDNEVNLKVIDTLKKETFMTVGYSDHSLGDLALRVAYTLGAEVMEFHFTDTRANKTFRDHKISLVPEEVKSLIKDIKKTPQELLSLLNDEKKINVLLGDGKKKPTKGEVETDHVTSFRRAIYSKKHLKAGDLLKKKDLICLRPNHGLDARHYDKYIGKKIKKNTLAFEKIQLIDME